MFRWRHFQLYFPLSVGYGESTAYYISTDNMTLLSNSRAAEAKGLVVSAGLGLGLTF